MENAEFAVKDLPLCRTLRLIDAIIFYFFLKYTLKTEVTKNDFATHYVVIMQPEM